MAWERFDISILVVDDDNTSLTIVANILSSWEYKVLTANSALNALETLGEFEGFFDLVITELHMSGMNGFEFQRRVTDEFQLPVIMMSSDRRKSVMSKSLENGAAHFMLKPICADDFKDIWQYATPAARKEKPINGDDQLRLRDNQGGDESLPTQGEKVTSQDAKSPGAASSVSNSEPKQKRKYRKRISSQVNDNKEDQSKGEGSLKRPKVVWTTHLHNLFLMAIKHIGLDKAVPKKILEIMNVPNLTRENVASHLQKYRIFLRKVAERGIIEGISDRALRSRFASELPVSVIKELKASAERLRLPVQRYLKGQGGPIIKGLHYSQASNNNSAYGTTSTQLGRGQQQQFPNLLHGGSNKVLQNQQALNNHYSNALKQVRLEKSSFGSKLIGTNIHVQEENMFGSYGSSVFDQAKSSYNYACPVFPAYGMERGLLTTSNALTGGLKKFGESTHQNNGSLGNQSLLSYGLGNNKMMAPLCNSNIPQPLSSSACYNNTVSSGIQMNGGSQMDGTGVMNGGFNSVGVTNAINSNNNSFGLMNGSYGTKNANANVNVTPPLALGQGNNSSGWVQGCYASPANRDVYASEVAAATFVTINVTPQQGNASGIQQLPQQVDGTWNATGNENQVNASSMIEGQANQVEDDISKFFSMLDDMQLLKETGENIDANQFLNSDFSSSSHAVQFPEVPQKAGDLIVPSAENNINLPNDESPITASTDKSPTQLQGNDGFLDWEPFDPFFVDNVSTASNSATEQVWDMELFEAVFGTQPN